MSLLGSGKEMGVEFTYRIRDEPGGIAQALSMAEGCAVFQEPVCSPIMNIYKG